MNEPVNDGSSLLGRTAGTAMAIGGSIAVAALGVGTGRALWTGAANRGRKGALAFNKAMGRVGNEASGVADDIAKGGVKSRATKRSSNRNNANKRPSRPDPNFKPKPKPNPNAYPEPIGPKATLREADYKQYMQSQRGPDPVTPFNFIGPRKPTMQPQPFIGPRKPTMREGNYKQYMQGQRGPAYIKSIGPNMIGNAGKPAFPHKGLS